MFCLHLLVLPPLPTPHSVGGPPTTRERSGNHADKGLMNHVYFSVCSALCCSAFAGSGFHPQRFVCHGGTKSSKCMHDMGWR